MLYQTPSALAVFLNACQGVVQAQKRSKRKADGISPAAQALAAARYHAPASDANPLEDAGWRTLVAKLAGATLPGVAKARERLGVTMEATKVGGVKAFMFIPRSMPEAHRNQVIFNIHGGGYVHGPGESVAIEATLISGLVGYRVIALDYRMPPTRPIPRRWTTRWRPLRIPGGSASSAPAPAAA